MPNGGRRDSLRAVATAATSPRVWAVVSAVSGWGFAAAVYVAGTARQSDLVLMKAEVKTLGETLAVVNVHANEAGQSALANHDSAVLAYRALASECARFKSSTLAGKDREQASAEARYDRSIKDGLTPAAAIREALR